jgi:hypothetical protein
MKACISCLRYEGDSRQIRLLSAQGQGWRNSCFPSRCPEREDSFIRICYGRPTGSDMDLGGNFDTCSGSILGLDRV